MQFVEYIAKAAISFLLIMTTQVVLANSIPLVIPPPVVEVEAGKAVVITLEGLDADNDALTYFVQTKPRQGTATLQRGTNRVSYTPRLTARGTDSFTFYAKDARSSSATATVSIRIIPPTPVAIAPRPVSLQEDSSASMTLAASSKVAGLIYRVASEPQRGSVVITGNKAVYTPSANYVGTDSFTFTVQDNGVISAPATVTLTITAVNDRPIAVAQTLTVPRNAATTLTLAGTDIDGDVLTFALASTPKPKGSVGAIQGGNKVTYTPKAGVNTDEFAFTVRDGKLTSAPAKVQLQITAVIAPTDPALLRCYGNTPPVWETLTTFTCDGIDLSTANLAQLANLPNLRTLSLTNAKLTNISGLTNLTQLTSLNLGFNKISTISALAGMTQLQSLNLGFNTISDITPLANLNALRELYLEANNISSISPLAGKTALTKLALDANNISDISALNGLSALTHVGLGYNRLTTAAALANKPLQVLVLDANHLTSLSSLPKPSTLRELYLRGNGTTATTVLSDIAPLNSGLANLNVLELGFNGISNAAPLATLTALTRLGLENNSLTTLSNLSTLTNVQTLDAENNLLATTAGIHSMTGLNGLVRIDNNRLLDVNSLSTAGGSKSLQLTLGDNCLSSVALPSRIKVVNLPWQFPGSRCGSTAPVAIGKHVEMLQNTPTTITLDVSDHLGNAINASNGVTYQLTSTNVSGGVLNTSGLANGSVSFTPSSANGGYLGDAGSFSFTATRNGQVSAAATISLRVIHPILSTCFGGSIPSEAALQSTSRFDCPGQALTDIGILQRYFPNIDTLVLDNNQIQDISVLNSTNFPNLIRLNLSKNPLDMGDFAALGNQLPSLIMLFLDEAQLDNDDLTALFGTAASPKLTGMQYLALRNNSISDITPLLHLNNLSTLLLANNQIQDVAALSPAAPAAVPLPALAEFTISANRLSTLSLARLANLTSLEANRNCLSAAPVVRTTTPLPSVSWTGQRALVNGVCEPAPQ